MKNNLYDSIPLQGDKELFENILSNGLLKLERIISYGQATPPGEWFDQENDEWVVLLKGSAGLLFEGDEEPITLLSGDYLLIPSHKRHRVLWTLKTEPTIWLALHFKGLE